jgi:hypothetical protein
VTPQYEPALETEEEVLADRGDFVEPPSVQALGNSRRSGTRMGCLDLERLADEGPEAAGGTVKAVTFGHGLIVPGRVSF